MGLIKDVMHHRLYSKLYELVSDWETWHTMQLV